MEDDEIWIAMEAEVRSLGKLIQELKDKAKFFRTLQKLEPKLRIKLRNAIWRNK